MNFYYKTCAGFFFFCGTERHLLVRRTIGWMNNITKNYIQKWIAKDAKLKHKTWARFLGTQRLVDDHLVMGRNDATVAPKHKGKNWDRSSEAKEKCQDNNACKTTKIWSRNWIECPVHAQCNSERIDTFGKSHFLCKVFTTMLSCLTMFDLNWYGCIVYYSYMNIN